MAAVANEDNKLQDSTLSAGVVKSGRSSQTNLGSDLALNYRLSCYIDDDAQVQVCESPRVRRSTRGEIDLRRLVASKQLTKNESDRRRHSSPCRDTPRKGISRHESDNRKNSSISQKDGVSLRHNSDVGQKPNERRGSGSRQGHHESRRHSDEGKSDGRRISRHESDLRRTSDGIKRIDRRLSRHESDLRRPDAIKAYMDKRKTSSNSTGGRQGSDASDPFLFKGGSFDGTAALGYVGGSCRSLNTPSSVRASRQTLRRSESALSKRSHLLLPVELPYRDLPEHERHRRKVVIVVFVGFMTLLLTSVLIVVVALSYAPSIDEKVRQENENENIQKGIYNSSTNNSGSEYAGINSTSSSKIQPTAAGSTSSTAANASVTSPASSDPQPG